MSIQAQSMGPLTIGIVSSMLENQRGEGLVLARLGLAVLVGHPPELGGFGWSFRTKPGDEELGRLVARNALDEEMLAWPLHNRRMDRRTGPAELTVGRATSNDLVITHASVSKLHARIYLEEAGPRIQDAGSSNGTLVNDRPLPPGGARLQDGDWLSLGPVKLRFLESRKLVDRLAGRA